MQAGRLGRLRRRSARWLGMLLVGLLAACAPGAAPANPTPVSPPAVFSPTLPAQPALPDGGSATPPARVPVATPAEAAPPATLAPTPLIAVQVEASPVPDCLNDARFIRDETIPDGTQLLPGQALVKKWSVQNAGTCDWGAGYRLVLISDDALGAPGELALYPARAGATVIWEIPMTAPQAPGAYTGRWQARDPAGNLFGAVVFIKIEVIPLPTQPASQ